MVETLEVHYYYIITYVEKVVYNYESTYYMYLRTYIIILHQEDNMNIFTLQISLLMCYNSKSSVSRTRRTQCPSKHNARHLSLG